MRVLKIFLKLIEKINNFSVNLACALTASVMLLICIEIIFRYFLSSSIPGSIEITEYCLLYITFLGSAWLVTQEKHVKMDLLLNRLSPKSVTLLNAISSLLGALICLVLTWYSGKTTWDQFQRGVFRPTTLEIPIAYTIAIIPIGSFIMSIEFLKNIFKHVRGWKEFRIKEKVLEKPFDSEIGY